MGPLIAILTVALVVLVALFLAGPLRRARRAQAVAGAPIDPTSRGQEPVSRGHAFADARHELEAAREAKYREIRDAELDFRTGKLSRADYDAIDADLRAEAIEILDRLERLTPRDA